MGGYVGKLQIGYNIQDQVAFGDLLYGVCNTNASAAAKVIEANNFTTFDRHVAGVQIRIKFTKGNSVTSGITLKVNVDTDSVAYPVFGDCTCDENEIVTFTFDEYQESNTTVKVWRVTGTNLTQSIKNYINAVASGAIGGIDSMVFKGTIGTIGATITELPSSGYTAGWTYKAITSDPTNNFGLSTTTGTGQGRVEPGDLIIAITNAGSNQVAFNSAHWTVVQTNIDGMVTGPVLSTDNAVAVFDGISGRIIKDSGFTIGTSVPSDAVFTNTSYQYGIANNTPVAVYNNCSTTNSGGTVLVSVANGVLKLEPGITFTTTNVMPSGMTLSETAVPGPALLSST